MKSYGERWNILGGMDSEIVAELLQVFVNENNVTPADLGYHWQWSSKYTDKTRILHLKKKNY